MQCSISVIIASCVIYHMIIIVTDCFNIDTNQVVTKEIDNNEGMFGFSVSPHFITAKKSYRILVGAPRDNMPGYDGKQEKRPGAIYSCPLTGKAKDCVQVVIPKSKKEVFFVAEKMIYSEQFLGMNLISATVYNGSNVFTCAPRRRGQGSDGRDHIMGVCYNLDNDLKYLSEIIVNLGNRKEASDHQLYWLMLIGMSAATNQRNELLIGAPFSSFSNRVPWIESGEVYFSKDGKNLGTSIKDDTFKTRPLYPGWSVAMGNILAGCHQTLVTGAPGIPGENLDRMKASEIGNGTVMLFGVEAPFRVKQRKSLTGPQFGARFGQTVLVADVNKDGWDDLFVGAPDFRSKRKDRNRVGSGAVFVYLNNKGSIPSLPSKELRPPARACKNDNCVQAQFGFALSNLGDVNLDGYNDIGISAPGDGGGAIYVFHGGKTPFASGRPAQRISLKTGKKLGFSLGQGMDLDNNGYPDLVAGALGSNSASVFRTRPVINLEVTMTFQPAILDANLPDNQAPWRACHDNKGFCFNANLNFSYAPASPKDKMKNNVDGEINIEAEKDRTLSRVQFLEGKKLSPKLTRKVIFKRTPSTEVVTLFIKSANFMDVLRPITFNVSWVPVLKRPEALDPASATLPSINAYPTFDKEKCELTAKLPWKTNCPTSGCESDLELRLQTSLDRGGELVYMVGKDAEIWLNFTAVNHVGTAHLVELRLAFDESLVVDKFECKFSCTQEKEAVCGIANPLAAGESSTCNLRLSTANIKPEMRNLMFAAKLTTTSKNRDKHQSQYNFNATVVIQASVHLTSRVNKEQIVYRHFKLEGASKIQHEQRIGDPRLQLTFQVENKMHTLVPASTLSILWPYELLASASEPHGKYLLYLLLEPLITGHSKEKVNCSGADLQKIINPVGVRLSVDKILKNITGAANSKPQSVPSNRIAGSTSPPKFVPCSNGLARCVPIRCKLGRLGKKTGTLTITLVARVWLHTLMSSFRDDKFVKIAVDAEWQSDPRYDVRQMNNTSTNSTIVIQASNLMEFQKKRPQHFMWIVIGASMGGLILLGCIIIVLWKCKFFQRKNLDKERQRIMRESRMHPTEAEAFFSDRPA